MCPMCTSAAAWLAVGAASAGGIAILAVRKLLPAAGVGRGETERQSEGEPDGTSSDRDAR